MPLVRRATPRPRVARDERALGVPRSRHSTLRSAALERPGLRRVLPPAGSSIDLALPPLHLVVHLARGGWITASRQADHSARPSLRGPLAVDRVARGRCEPRDHRARHRQAARRVDVVREPAGRARAWPASASTRSTRRCRRDARRAPATARRGTLEERPRRPGGDRRRRQRLLGRDPPCGGALAVPARRCADTRANSTGWPRRFGTCSAPRSRSPSDSDPAIAQGRQAQSMRVHGRAGLRLPGLRRHGARGVAVASQSFQYCPGCQTGGRVFADRRMSRLLR